MEEQRFMKKMAGRFAASLAVCMTALLLQAQTPLQAANVKDGVTFEELNEDSVFLKQSQARICTLTASTMMLRRAAMLSGDEDWDEITESSVRKNAWVEGTGLKWNFSSAGFSVTQKSLSSKKELISMLEKHPEGIVIYNTSKPHAILITDYTDGVFYCSDPSNAAPKGRYPVANASISVESASRCWYVKTPTGLAIAPDGRLVNEFRYTVGNLEYVIVDAEEKTAACAGIAESTKSARIPKTVKIDGITYRVVKVAERAFAENTELSAVRIGANVVAVETEAFYNCINLRRVIIESARLKKIGENAFGGISQKASILVGEEQVEQYTNLLSMSAMPESAVVKAGQ